MRSAEEVLCDVRIEPVNGEGVIFLTVPEDVKAGERVAIWTSQKALGRLSREIAAARAKG